MLDEFGVAVDSSGNEKDAAAIVDARIANADANADAIAVESDLLDSVLQRPREDERDLPGRETAAASAAANDDVASSSLNLIVNSRLRRERLAQTSRAAAFASDAATGSASASASAPESSSSDSSDSSFTAFQIVCILVIFACVGYLVGRVVLPRLFPRKSAQAQLAAALAADGTPSLLAAASLSQDSPKKAVLIGINYMGTPNELAGCISDIRNVERLLRANGFAEIVVLSDVDAKQPTRANILAALKGAAAATKPGDVLYVHYSGHGGLTSSAARKKDSTLIPLDFQAAGVITDAEIKRDFIDALPAGATALVVIDACHSAAVDLRYTYVDASFREVAMRMGSYVSTSVETPHKIAHDAAHAAHKKARRGAESPAPSSSRPSSPRPSSPRSSSPSSPRPSSPRPPQQEYYKYKLRSNQSPLTSQSSQNSQSSQSSPPHSQSRGAHDALAVATAAASAAATAASSAFIRALDYTQYFKPRVTYAEHLEAREHGHAQFVKTLREWKSKDVVPVEDVSASITPATVVVFSGCKDMQTSADTSFDSIPSGAFTWAFLVALCGSFTSTKIQSINLRDLMKKMRCSLATAGYTQIPMISCGNRIKIDEVTIDGLLKLEL